MSHEPEHDRRPIPQLARDELLALRADLIAYARFMLRKHPARGPLGQASPEDLAGSAILWALDQRSEPGRRRRWDPATTPLDVWCRGAIRSAVWNSRTSKDCEYARDMGDSLAHLNIPGAEPDILGALVARETYAALVAALRDDEVALLVLDVMMNDPEASSGEIAAVLGLREAEVKNTRRRIRRRLQAMSGLKYDDPEA